MYYLNVVFSFFLALFAWGMISMGGIFAAGGMVAPGSTASVAMADTLMWISLIMGLAAMVLNIWGQVKYKKAKEGDSTTKALWMMYASIPLFICFVVVIFTVLPS